MGVEQAAAAHEDLEPWPGILTQPRRALRLAADRGSWVWPFGVFLLSEIAETTLKDLTDGKGSGLTGFGSLTALGTALGMLGIAAGAFVLVVVILPWKLGRMFGGHATPGQVFVVMLWSLVPSMLVNPPLNLVGWALHGTAWWSMSSDAMRHGALLELPATAQLLSLLGVGLTFWMAGLQIIGLSEVHGISKLRATAVVVLPLFILGVIAAIAAAVLVVLASQS